jgi:TolA-binding protein
MKLSRLLALSLILVPALASAANKEMIELQRDVAQLQEQLRLLQQSVDTKMSAIEVLARQASDGTGRATNSVTELQRAIQSSSVDLGRQVAQPIASMNNRLDSLSGDVQGLQNSMADQNSRMAKMQQQMTDLLQAIKTMQPAAPPPSTLSPDGSTPPGGTMPAGGAPPISATQLFANANRDMSGGNADLALAEFSDYVKYYRDTQYAPTAQFNIGQIHFFQKKYDLAVADFDQVLEAFPINEKTADAHYFKGRALMEQGQRLEAMKEFRVCVSQFATSSVAPKCKQSITANPTPIAPKKKPARE